MSNMYYDNVIMTIGVQNQPFGVMKNPNLKIQFSRKPQNQDTKCNLMMKFPNHNLGPYLFFQNESNYIQATKMIDGVMCSKSIL